MYPGIHYINVMHIVFVVIKDHILLAFKTSMHFTFSQIYADTILYRKHVGDEFINFEKIFSLLTVDTQFCTARTLPNHMTFIPNLSVALSLQLFYQEYRMPPLFCLNFIKVWRVNFDTAV